MQHVLRCCERQPDSTEYKKTLRRPGLRWGSLHIWVLSTLKNQICVWLEFGSVRCTFFVDRIGNIVSMVVIYYGLTVFISTNSN